MRNPFDNAGFKYHFLAYVLVNAILIIVNLTHREQLWFLWPLIGWGIGVAAHGWAVTRRTSDKAQSKPAPSSNTTTGPRP